MVVIVSDSVLVLVDLLLLGGGGDGGEGIELLEVTENFSVVEDLLFGGGFNTEGHAGGFPADDELGVMRPLDLDGLHLNGLKVSDLLLGGVRLGSEDGDLGIFLGLEGLQLEAHVGLLDLATFRSGLDFELGADGEGELSVLLKTSSVGLAVEGGNETEGGFGLGRVHELDLSRGLGRLEVAGDLGLDFSLDLALSGNDGGPHKLVHEGKTGSGWEGQGEGFLVVHLLEVEVLAVSHLLEHVLEIWKRETQF